MLTYVNQRFRDEGSHSSLSFAYAFLKLRRLNPIFGIAITKRWRLDDRNSRLEPSSTHLIAVSFVPVFTEKLNFLDS